MLTDKEFNDLSELLEKLEDIETHVDIEYSGEEIV